MNRLLLCLMLVLLTSSCTTTHNYTIVYFDKESIGDRAQLDMSMDAQFSTSKTVSPTTELDASVPLNLKTLTQEVRKLREQQRELINPKQE